MKKAFVISVVALLLIAGFGIRHIIRLDGDPWQVSHRLSESLAHAREVTLVEHILSNIITRKIATPDEISRLKNATGVSLWPFNPSAFLCFEPHHRIEIRRADGSLETVEICFLCDNFSFTDNDGHNYPVALPPSTQKSLTQFFASVGMKPKTHDEYLKITSSDDHVEGGHTPP